MATSEQIKSLLRAHVENNNEKFKTVSLQIAVHEAKLGHNSYSRELREIIQSPKNNSKSIIFNNSQNEFFQLINENYRLSDLVVSENIKNNLDRIITEYKKRSVLQKNGLANRRKLLLEGPPGTGKTMTASVIATELNLPLYFIQMDKLMTKFMGETSIKLRKIFDLIYNYQGIYLFDEFDAIGADRSIDSDVGEMRRILNSFLQFLEQDESDSIIISATNNPKLLDNALFRRFDDVLQYGMPDIQQIDNLLQMKLSKVAEKDVFSVDVYNMALGLSHADISTACDNSLKEKILNATTIDSRLLIKMLNERKYLLQLREAK